MSWVRGAASTIVLLAAFDASGSLTAERVFLVVNQRSWSSRAIANRFVQLNRVPQSNVFAMDWDGPLTSVRFSEFREQLLRPIFRELQRRHLETQIDCIVYSSDFPYAVDFRDELPRGDKDRFPSGSLTGLTYLYQQLGTAGAAFRSPEANWYGIGQDNRAEPFSAQASWSAQGQSVSSGQRRYMLAAMLGYVSGRGAGVEDVERYLGRGALATSSDPVGTVYFLTNGDIRSKVRSPRFSAVTHALEQLGVRGEILEGAFPQGKKDILGAVIGRHAFRIADGSRILPGAVCDNLTSFGGVLDDSGSQLPLTRFLEQGAAGSSGTVIEPFALAPKFPDPIMHVHYTKGLSMAESFYRSTRSPYQILLVGDPLCQPWAPSARVDVGDFADSDQLAGTVELRPSLEGQATAREFELFVNGRAIGSCRPGQQFVVDTRAFPDGYHEIRVVAILDNEVESACRWLGWRNVQNHGHSCKASSRSRRMPLGNQLAIDLTSSAPMTYHVFHHRRQLSLPTSASTVVIDTSDLGLGANSLQVVGVTQENIKVFAKPLSIFLESPRQFKSQVRQTGRPLTLVKADGSRSPVDTRKRNWISQSGIDVGERFEVSGDLLAKTAGVHQLQVYFAGRMSIYVDGSRVLETWHAKRERKEVPVNLAKGYHALRIACTPADTETCELRFGYRGARKLKTDTPPKPK